MGARFFTPSNNIIFKSLVGSRLYGTHTLNSDFDYVSVCIAPIEQYLSNDGFNQTEHQSEQRDYTIYDIRKAVKLMADNNPNMIELLYVPDGYIVTLTPFWETLRNHRDWFLSKKAKFTFSGYANSQLKRLTNHKKWLDNPVQKPKRKDYDLPQTKNIPKKYEKAMLSLPNEFVKSELKDRIKKERKFREAMREYSKYNQWKTKRNPKRYALEKKIGYDAKHAMHLYRLLCMGVEILEEGTIIVDRRNRNVNELMEIRNCEWEYNKLINKVKEKENLLEELYQTSSLQNRAKYNKIDELMIEIIKEYNEKKEIYNNVKGALVNEIDKFDWLDEKFLDSVIKSFINN